MASKKEVVEYLEGLKLKIRIFGLIFLDDRGKNSQTLLDLEIAPIKRRDIIAELKTEDYSEGPLEDKMHGILPMWVFGKMVKGKEIYIKISMGQSNRSSVCISFHIAEYPMKYPFKD
jgi:hypothetical protein